MSLPKFIVISPVVVDLSLFGATDRKCFSFSITEKHTRNRYTVSSRMFVSSLSNLDIKPLQLPHHHALTLQGYRAERIVIPSLQHGGRTVQA